MAILNKIVIVFFVLVLFQTQVIHASESTNYKVVAESQALEDLYKEGLISKKRYLFEQQSLQVEKIQSKRRVMQSIQGVTGSLSGNITDGSNSPIDAHIVTLYNINNLFNPVANTSTNNLGNYNFDNLADGDYVVFTGTNNDGYLHYVWQNITAGGPRLCQQCNASVTADSYINLASGNAITGIDFSIELGGVISGFIQDATTLAGVDTLTVRAVNINDTSYNLQYQFSLLNATTGQYKVSGIPNGSYKLYLQGRFDANNQYIPQLHGDSQCNVCSSLAFDGQGTDFVIDTLNTISSIDFNVNKGASVSGKIVDSISGASLQQYGYLVLFDELNQLITQQLIYGTNFDANATGDYFLGGLLPGSYYIQGGDLGFDFYQREVYANKPCYWSGCDRSTGDVVVLGDRESAQNIDFLLEKGGKIAGTITDELSANPITIANDQVQFYHASGYVVGGARAKNDGTYVSARGLPEGDYAVRTGNLFAGNLTSPYLNEKYNDIECSGLACDLSTADVNVVAETTVANVDFALGLGLSFSGTITEVGTALPIANVHVLVYKDMGVGQEPKFANWATTNDGSNGAIGSFVVDGLPVGTYYAVTNNGSRLPFDGIRPASGAGWVDILYDGMACPAGGCDISSGTPIVLDNVRGTAPLLNMTLSSGASISGKVTDSVLNNPIADVKINVYNLNGDFFGSYTSDASGFYRTAGLDAGSYYLTTSSFDVLVDVKYGDEPCYIDNCNSSEATPIVLSELEYRQNINFTLKPDFVFSNGLESVN